MPFPTWHTVWFKQWDFHLILKKGNRFTLLFHMCIRSQPICWTHHDSWMKRRLTKPLWRLSPGKHEYPCHMSPPPSYSSEPLRTPLSNQMITQTTKALASKHKWELSQQQQGKHKGAPLPVQGDCWPMRIHRCRSGHIMDKLWLAQTRLGWVMFESCAQFWRESKGLSVCVAEPNCMGLLINIKSVQSFYFFFFTSIYYIYVYIHTYICIYI